MDSLRGDHLGCAGHSRAHTPTIDALAAGGILFSENIAQSTYTRVSVPSTITAKYPYFAGIRMMIPDLDSSHVTLAEALAAEGYFTYGILQYWRPGFFQGLEKLDKENDSTIQKTRWCLQALDELDDRPFFIWLYYWDPHAPYTPPVEQMRRYESDYVWDEQAADHHPQVGAADRTFRDASGHYAGSLMLLLEINRGHITPNRAERDHLINLYDAEISFVDDWLKQVIDKIKDLGQWDRTMVVLNADHGEAFGEHGYYYHGYSIYDEEVRVPLIIKLPDGGVSGKVVDGPVRNLDIMPTVLDYCGIPAPEGIQGRSLRPFMETDQRPQLPTCIETHRLHTQTHLLGYRDGRHKLIYNLAQGDAELYDLSTDPGEQLNLLSGGTVEKRIEELESRLRGDLLDMLEVKDLAVLKLGDANRLMDERTRERLKALGYIY
jgi:arylsulfatase A-like enzyme